MDKLTCCEMIFMTNMVLCIMLHLFVLVFVGERHLRFPPDLGQDFLASQLPHLLGEMMEFVTSNTSSQNTTRQDHGISR